MEGCDGQSSDDLLGLLTSLHLGDSEPFHASFCQQNQGAYGPAVKLLFQWLRREHFLEANISIDCHSPFPKYGYGYRFQSGRR
ncbi:MAG: hypothetical protein R2788_02155 [Saprospiraceae bacterium]